jgi:hypothetical protein
VARGGVCASSDMLGVGLEAFAARLGAGITAGAIGREAIGAACAGACVGTCVGARVGTCMAGRITGRAAGGAAIAAVAVDVGNLNLPVANVFTNADAAVPGTPLARSTASIGAIACARCIKLWRLGAFSGVMMSAFKDNVCSAAFGCGALGVNAADFVPTKTDVWSPGLVAGVALNGELGWRRSIAGVTAGVVLRSGVGALGWKDGTLVGRTEIGSTDAIVVAGLVGAGAAARVGSADCDSAACSC